MNPERKVNPKRKYEIHTYSYLALRKAIGWIGILLPFVLILGNFLVFRVIKLEPSISLCYYTPMRDVLVGGLCAVALFLFFYAGYNKWDNRISTLAGIFALIVAWFPASETGIIGIINLIHFIAAGLFFLTLSFISLFLFTRKEDNPSPEKLKRNAVYRACGITMLACMAAMVIWFLIYGSSASSPFIYVMETIALIAFGVSWLTKGGTLLPDK
jgi:hypothetical protein